VCRSGRRISEWRRWLGGLGADLASYVWASVFRSLLWSGCGRVRSRVKDLGRNTGRCHRGVSLPHGDVLSAGLLCDQRVENPCAGNIAGGIQPG
jgi:hypothetical protein